MNNFVYLEKHEVNTERPINYVNKCLNISAFSIVIVLSFSSCTSPASSVDEEVPSWDNFIQDRYFTVIPTCLPNCTSKDRFPEYNKSNIRKTILEMVSVAKSSIDIGVYNFSVREIFYALVRKIEKEDVIVRVLFPKHRLSDVSLKNPCLSSATKSQLFYNLQILQRGEYLNSKCPDAYKKLNLLEIMYLTVNNMNGSMVVPITNTHGGLFHEKIMLVDGKIALVGSGNFTYNGIGLNLEEFTMFGTAQSAIVRRFLCEFDGIANNKNNNCSGNGVFFTPAYRNVQQMIKDKIISSEKTINIFVHQFDIDDIFRQLHSVSSNKSIKIKLIMSGERCSFSEMERIKQFASPNFEVRFFYGNYDLSQFAHAKFAIFDENSSIFGCGNWTTQALTKSNEYYILTTSKSPKVESLSKMFNIIWDNYASSLENCKARSQPDDE